jgi:acyl-CoA synthetase (AMP-forming)/AMP-acid ligase II
VAPGEIGEVITRSDCVMDGYWQNAEANAEALRGGWLHTGDLGSIDEDGLLTLRDRSKDMIISGGSNICPREIEEVLLRHPDLVEASVVGRPPPDWGEEIIAFFGAARWRHCRGGRARPDQVQICDRVLENRPGSVLVLCSGRLIE